MSAYINKICNFSEANGPFRDEPYRYPTPSEVANHPNGYLMQRTEYDRAQIQHFCPGCSMCYKPMNPQSYSCEGQKCVLQQVPANPPSGYYSSMTECVKTCRQ